MTGQMREVPTGYTEESTQRVAAPRAQERPGTESVFLFRLGQEWLALPTAAFERVVATTAVHPVPHRRGGILLGIGSVAGDLLPIASLASLLEINADPSPAATARIVVLHWKRQRLALPVDEAYGVYRFHPDELQRPPGTLHTATAFTAAVLPWRGYVVAYLHIERVVQRLVEGIA